MSLSRQYAIKQAISRAKKAFKKGDIAAAIQHYNSALQIHPKHPIAKKGLRQLQKNFSHDKSIQEQIINPPKNQIDALASLYSSGQIIEAEQACRELLQTYPRSLFVLNLFGAVLNGQGKLQEALQAVNKTIQIHPNFVDAYNNRGVLLIEFGQLEEAVDSFDKAIQIRPDYAEAYNSRGVALKEFGQLEEAVDSFDKAIQIRPDYAESYYNRGVALKEFEQLEEAVDSFDKAIQIRPDYAESYYNRGVILKEFGKIDEALQTFQTAVEKNPENILLNESLINLLNYHLTDNGTRNAYVEAQKALQLVTPKLAETPTISNETVRQLYLKCHSILKTNGLSEVKYTDTLIWRGGIPFHGNCDHFLKVFKTHKVIPEHCFKCFKVLIEPQTVVELIKLMLIFDTLKLPNDNVRKCLVEGRPGISGKYKGLIYCQHQDFDEAKEIFEIAQATIGEKISKKIPVSIKRGCSEYPLIYPEFGYTNDNGQFKMAYNEEWRKYENEIDKNMTENNNFDWGHNHNHLGLTLRDALIMRNWLKYAETNEDMSYLEI